MHKLCIIKLFNEFKKGENLYLNKNMNFLFPQINSSANCLFLFSWFIFICVWYFAHLLLSIYFVWANHFKMKGHTRLDSWLKNERTQKTRLLVKCLSGHAPDHYCEMTTGVRPREPITTDVHSSTDQPIVQWMTRQWNNWSFICWKWASFISLPQDDHSLQLLFGVWGWAVIYWHHRFIELELVNDQKLLYKTQGHINAHE